jgi:hypothetical protein
MLLTLTALLLAQLAELPAEGSTETKPTILRAVDPVRPGETVMLSGDWPITASVEVAQLTGQADGAALSWQHLEPLQVSSQSMKFAIPATWAMGAYACRVIDGAAPHASASATMLLNLPDPWWLRGDGSATAAAPGGWLRIFGKALHFDAPSHVRIEGASRKIKLVAQASKDTGGYALTVALPADLPTGLYTVAVHNGFGGSNAWRPAGHIQIRPTPIWKQEVFDVSKFGPTTNDCTAAVKAALAKAASNSGGVVHFPRGRYLINEELVIPPFVTLKGEGEGLVNLYWPNREQPLNSLISGTDDFAVEDLAIYTSGIHKNAITGRNNVRVQRVRIRANFYQRHDFVGKAHAGIPLVAASSANAGAGVMITGDNVVITDCDIYHSDKAITLKETFGGLIARNRLDYGFTPLQCYGLSRVIFEDNECAGAGLWASGSGFGLYHSCATYHLYFAHNRIRQAYGGDGECLTTDGHGTAYVGKIANVQGGQITLADEIRWGSGDKHLIPEKHFQFGLNKWRPKGDFATEEWHGVTLYILGGRGAGQYRNLLAGAGKQVTLEQAFTIPPDTSSIVSIGKFQGRHLIVGNEFRDGRFSVQLYAPCCDCIVAENQVWRTASMSTGASLGLRAPITGDPRDIWVVEPGWFHQFLNNHIWEGNGWGSESSVLGILSAQVTWPKIAPEIREVTMSRGHVIRGNQLDSNAHIEVNGPVSDVIIEHNTMQNVEQGVTVVAPPKPASGSAPAPSRGIWIGSNTFHHVANPGDMSK